GKDVLEAAPDQIGRPHAVVADLKAADLDVLEQQVVGLHGRDPAGGEADDDEAAAPGESANGGVEDVTAERVDDDVGARARRQRADLRPQALMQVGQGEVDG